jgi:DNA invertase Pin-like site-specific DNA recombinase
MKQPKENTLSAVIYARYSSHNQREVSIEQQVEECREYAQHNNYDIVAVYADKHTSGRSDRRPEFQRMMRDAEKHRFQLVISYKSNRISRNMMHALQYEERLSRLGIRVCYAKEEYGDTAAGRFALRTMMNVNQFYSESMAEDIRRGMMDNAQKCMVNSALPYGYMKGPDGKFAINPDTAPVAQEIFRRVAANETYKDIALDLNTRGIRNSLGNRWGKSSFKRMLTNEAYIGVYQFAEVRIENGVPPLITKEVFETVRNRVNNQRHAKGRHQADGDYLLTGKLFCGHCKRPMTGISGTAKSGDLYYYYICQGRRLNDGCDKTNVRREWLHEQVAGALQQQMLSDKAIAWMADQAVAYGKHLRETDPSKETEKQLSDVKRAINNIMKAIEQGIFTETTKGRLEELEQEQKTLSTRLNRELRKLPDISREKIIYRLESCRNGDIKDPKYQKFLFDTFLNAVYLYDDKMHLDFNYTGDGSSATVPLGTDPPPDDIEALSQSSFKLCAGPPQQSQTNSGTIYMIDNRFILVAPLK